MSLGHAALTLHFVTYALRARCANRMTIHTLIQQRRYLKFNFGKRFVVSMQLVVLLLYQCVF